MITRRTNDMLLLRWRLILLPVHARAARQLGALVGSAIDYAVPHLHRAAGHSVPLTPITGRGGVGSI